MAQRLINPAVSGIPTFAANTKADGHIAKTGDTVAGSVKIKLSKLAIGDTRYQWGTSEEFEFVNAFGNTIFGILCGGGSFDQLKTEMSTARGVIEAEHI